MIHYILQTIAFQLLFLLVYDLFLKRETFFNWNRLYLLFTPLLSLLLPFVQIGGIREAIPPSYTVQLPAVLVGGTQTSNATATGGFEFPWMALWLTGLLVSMGWFIFKYFRIRKIEVQSSDWQHPKMRVKLIPGSNSAFTFFSTVYLGAELSEKQKEHILLHEQIHVEEHHTWDLILFEVLRIVFWFNPLVYVFQKRIAALHEFSADRKVAMAKERNAYYQHMLSQVFQTDHISFINTFFNHSLIKKRIIMLQKSRSKRIFQLKYLLILPVICGMLVYTSCAQESDIATNETDNANNFVNGTNSEILDNIASLQEAIASQGELTAEEKKALKLLYVNAGSKGADNLHFDSKGGDQDKLAFAAIDKVPTYPGCEGQTNEAAKKCFTEKVAGFVVQNFNTKVPKDSPITGKQRIAVHFTITNTGNIENVRAKAEYPQLIDEAVRVVKMLPKMGPGEHKGKKVNVEFALPIVFEMD